MKKVIFLTFTLVLAYFNSFGYIINIYSRTTSGGGPDGYNWTHKVVYDDGFVVKMTYIECSGQGYSECPTMINLEDAEDGVDHAWINELSTFAVDRIALGVTSGSRSELVNIYPTSLNRNYVVSWGYNGSGEMIISITREDL